MRNFIRECTLHPLLFMILLQLIRLYVQLHVLRWVVASSHATPSPFHLLPSRNLHVASSLHSRSLQSFFHHQWTCWACNLVLLLCCQQPSYIHCIWYVVFNYCSWCCLLWCYCCHLLMFLSRNNLMSSWVGKFVDTWSTASPSVLWMWSSYLLS